MTEAERLAKEYELEMVKDSRIRTYALELAQAFYAGYEAGKPKWHKVADGDLPREEGYYLVFNKGTRNIIIGMFVDGKFESCFPVAWCELPKFEEELS